MMQLGLFMQLEDTFSPTARRMRRPVRKVGSSARPARKAPKQGEWGIVDHACRQCHGRLLAGVNAESEEIVRCAECGAQETGPPEALCCCGVEMAGHGRILECFRNPEVTITAPQEILVRERPAET